MQRTTLLLPSHLKAKATKMAATRGVSFGEFVRNAIEMLCAKRTAYQNNDPFFDDKNTYKGKVPSDISENHDEYLD